MILYRGSLKSCDQSCIYCPFSKQKSSVRELERDRAQWLRFVESLPERAKALDVHALMVVPYGEALLHPWYWEGLARLSGMEWMEAVGAQTNLSFSVEGALGTYLGAGGQVGKLRLWATFHPEMVSVEAFAGKCAQIQEAGAALCVGAVGVPEGLGAIRRLKEALPEGIYLWINKMDGLKRSYTMEEKEAFLDIDPYFGRELACPPSDASRCRGRLFVEGDGKVRACNLSLPYGVGQYTWQEPPPMPKCKRRVCSCYLAYGGRDDPMNTILFGRYPLFRIPRRLRAVFFDIDGTLIPRGGSSIPAHTAAGLAGLAREGVYLFFATTLPYGEAMERCRGYRHLFAGGVFAGGAHIRLEKKDGVREKFYCFDGGIRHHLEGAARTLVYRSGEGVYKMTLLRPRRRPWEEREAAGIWEAVPASCRGSLRYFLEGSCMQIVSAEADKATGASILCQWLGIPLSEAAAAGDSKEDEGLLRFFGA